MSQAYQQLLLDESSRQYVVINTHKGLFRYLRLPFRVSSAPGIFQRVMKNLLQDIPGVVVYIDDVLITGPDESGHIAALEEVLRRMEQAGLRLSKGKCSFMAPSVEYVGYKIDADGFRCARDTLLRDSCDSHLLFPLREEECDDCACFIMLIFI